MDFHRPPVLIVLFLLAFSITACETSAGEAALLEPNVYEVDPLFRDFYKRLGGEELQGPVISPLFTNGQLSHQYTLAGLMAYDPQAAEHERFSLVPLGLELRILEAAVQPPDDPNLLYVDGHVIDPAFEPIYQELGGERLVGRPLGEARYNPYRGRVEQYFENLGFYRTESDPPEQVHLLAYGFWKCRAYCTLPSAQISETVVDQFPSVGSEFRTVVDRLGQSFTGFALSAPHVASDGATEQAFENLVLVVPSGGNGRVVLRPLPTLLGMSPEPFVSPSNNPGLFFYPVTEGKGYNVPKAFLDYLARHGGLDAAGPPIGGLAQIGDGVFRQCFANLCLEEHRQEPGNLRIRPTYLGFTYWQGLSSSGGQGEAPVGDTSQGDLPSYADPPTLAPTQELTQPAGDGVIVHVWKRFPVLAPGQRQEIGVIVLRQDLPVPDLHTDLILSLSDAETVRFDMQPTGSDGQSQYLLEPLDKPLGTLVRYQVCVYYQPGEATCVLDSFIIWQ